MQTTDMIRMMLINKSGGLLTVDLLIKRAIEKCILDIELTDWPRAGDSNGENNPYSGGLDDRTECVVIINSRTLRVATNNPASLVPGETTIGVEFMTVNPLPGDNIGMRRTGNKGPSLVVNKSLVLSSHGLTP
jgi:hypothetical protein